MKKNYISVAIACALIGSLVISCKKSNPEDNCAQILQVKITGARTSYYTGDTISLGTSLLPDGLYIWNQSNVMNAISNGPTVFIPSCTKYDEGWYYLAVSYPDCASHFDSVYIKVTNKPAVAPCTPANNTVTFSSIPSIAFSSASWQIDPSWNFKDLSGYQSYGYPDINIYFHPYWNNKEPEDGEYTVGNMASFSDNDLYKIAMTSLYSSVYFEAGPGKAYVSHVGGKIQVTFCSVPFSGDLGNQAYTTSASGRLTAP